MSRRDEKDAAPTVGWTRRDFVVAGAALGVSIGVLPLGCDPAPVGGEGGKEEPSGGGEQWVDGRPTEPEPRREPGPEPRGEPGPEPRPEPGPEPTQDEPHAQEAGPEPEPGGETPPEPQAVAFAPEKIPIDAKLFPLQVQAGSMRSTSAIVWSFTSDSKAKQLKVWRKGPTPGTAFMAIDRQVQPNFDGYMKEKVEGLQGGQWYFYAFFEGSQKRSTIGKFRSAFAPGTLAPLTIGATSCTKSTYAPYKSLQMTAKQPVDLLVHLGDMSYNDDAKTLTEYRKIWKKTLTTGGYIEMLPQAGMYTTWDDHEVDNDFNPETMDSLRLNAAREAFFETLPVEEGPNYRLWNSYLWGDTAEIFVLDCRCERKPSTRKSSDPIYISKAQMAWLKQGLSQSKAHFKILLNSVPITDMPGVWIKEDDRWEGYGKQRDELLDHITTQKIKNVWFLSGDFHTSFVSHLEKSGDRSKMFEIACGPGGSFPNPLGTALLRRTAYPSNQFEFGQSVTSAMTLLTFDPKTNQVRVRFVNAKDNKDLFDKKLSQS